MHRRRRGAASGRDSPPGPRRPCQAPGSLHPPPATHSPPRPAAAPPVLWCRIGRLRGRGRHQVGNRDADARRSLLLGSRVRGTLAVPSGLFRSGRRGRCRVSSSGICGHAHRHVPWIGRHHAGHNRRHPWHRRRRHHGLVNHGLVNHDRRCHRPTRRNNARRLRSHVIAQHLLLVPLEPALEVLHDLRPLGDAHGQTFHLVLKHKGVRVCPDLLLQSGNDTIVLQSLDPTGTFQQPHVAARLSVAIAARTPGPRAL
mmetsp:Transcript_60473/g.187296  ORF Transcript_60473/g.187296 Transcript_60473/m.187296 type:complete len:256 (-) Transcript_60473:560-1327(-)